MPSIRRVLVAMDIMTFPVVAVGPDSTLDEVCDLLVARGLSAVAVIDLGVLAGIVSEEDLIHRTEIGTAAPRRSWWFQLFGNNTALATNYLKSHSVRVTDIGPHKRIEGLEIGLFRSLARFVRRKLRRIAGRRDSEPVLAQGRSYWRKPEACFVLPSEPAMADGRCMTFMVADNRVKCKYVDCGKADRFARYFYPNPGMGDG